MNEIDAVDEFTEEQPSSLPINSRKIRKVSMSSGPIPSPQRLAEYKAISSDLPERIIAMAEKEQAHRHMRDNGLLDLERENFTTMNKDMKYSFTLATGGMVFAFIITCVVVFLGYRLIVAGHDTAGLVAIIAPLIGLIAVFFHGKTTKKSSDTDSK